ncbi:uncharacterized protein LOC132747565 [Ruditapes philippinarum]|uniref:uncharacterized protein LOC132747565 n=1 Tax=Ruditapes philippinarum TaxID=129788 RepID=UPI00295BA73B|nr:uncharacterized protein LOC132747565 [Ruditapes philippinarum]
MATRITRLMAVGATIRTPPSWSTIHTTYHWRQLLQQVRDVPLLFIGLGISGAAFYNPYTGFGWNAVEGECAETLDNCWGHPSPDGTYHYHRIPSCLYTEPYEDIFLGVALDGYPIYGPMDATGKTWTSAELDVCHGHTYLGPYIYRATFDFPYILSCFHGQDVKNGENGRRRRDVSNHVYRRQAPPGIPPGLDNDPCWHAENAQWQQLSCFVVCENAGSDLSNCPVSDLAASPSVATMGVIYMVMTYFCI